LDIHIKLKEISNGFAKLTLIWNLDIQHANKQNQWLRIYEMTS
jgi:hypothetical protein